MSEIKVRFLDEKLGCGPIGTAIRERRCAISRNIATDAHMEAWQKPASQRGYNSLASIPIYKNGKIFGAFSVYSADPYGFDTDDESLLIEIGGDISFALDKLESEESRNSGGGGAAEKRRKIQPVY